MLSQYLLVLKKKKKKKRRRRAWHKIVKIGQVMVKFKYIMTSANDPMLRNTLL